MCSLEKLKELAIKQMRSAADLYGVCEKAEQGMEKDDDQYNGVFLRVQRDYRYDRLEHQFGIKPTEEEKNLWNEIIKEPD